MAEVGVYRGDFAKEVLQRCEELTTYYMIDPWRHLSDWNKPANHEDAVLEQFFEETKAKTDFAAGKRVILRGKTTEVIEQLADNELDFAYIDADHTLRGIAIDLIRVYPKVRFEGFVGGDDFTISVWQHDSAFEPTMVFPFVVYFAEAVGATVYALPNSQFCIQKRYGTRFRFVDLTGKYNDLSLRSQFALGKIVKLAICERLSGLMRFMRKSRHALVRSTSVSQSHERL